MTESFLLTRILVIFNGQFENLVGDISAAAITPNGSLWVASDERLGIERLSQTDPYVFSQHQHFAIADFIELFNDEDEIDIEGMDYSENYLWLVGSHSTKRKKPKGKKIEKDIARLATIATDANRYLIARIPAMNGELVKSCSPSDNPDEKLTAASLEKTEKGNILMDALAEDEHLSTIITSQFPSKDNGFDIEGLAVRHNRIFLGLRGPVLRGWAIILELELEEKEPGILTLKAIGQSGQLYRKHFVDLNGMGVRELCWRGDDLIILAGPTMDLEGTMGVFKLSHILDRKADSISPQDSEHLQVLFDLPFVFGADRAEGLTLFPCLGQSEALMVVYDSPHDRRKPNPHQVYADVFQLK